MRAKHSATFRARAATLRNRLKLTRDRFALLVGVSLGTVARWELEGVEPFGPTLAVVAALEVVVSKGQAPAVLERFESGSLGLGGGPRLYALIFRVAFPEVA